MENARELAETRPRMAAQLTGARKTAVLLMAVGETLAKEILRALPDSDVQRITEELTDLRGVTPELSAHVLEEFWEMLETQNFMVHGGQEYARGLLIETFGKQRAEDLMTLVRRSQEASQGKPRKAAAHRPAAVGQAA